MNLSEIVLLSVFLSLTGRIWDPIACLSEKIGLMTLRKKAEGLFKTLPCGIVYIVSRLCYTADIWRLDLPTHAIILRQITGSLSLCRYNQEIFGQTKNILIYATVRGQTHLLASSTTAINIAITGRTPHKPTIDAPRFLWRISQSRQFCTVVN